MKKQRKKRKNRFWVKGSYTVEAAFIMPMVLGIIFAMMFLLFCFHDGLVLQNKLQEEMLLSLCEGKEYSEAEWRQVMQHNVWHMRVTEGASSKDSLFVQTKVSGKMRWNIPVMERFLKKLKICSFEKRMPLVQPEELMRLKQNKNQETETVGN